MAQSLSLAAYLAYARRGGNGTTMHDIPRPKGAVIWAHAVDAGRADALVQLAERLAAQRPGLHMVLTTPDDSAPVNRNSKAVIWRPLPEDTIASAESFLAHWHPALCLWTGGDLKPALLTTADKMGLPLYLVDADEQLLTRRSWRWFPDMPRALLSLFTLVIARNEATARLLRRLGIQDEDIAVTGPFREGTISLPCNESDREELAGLLRGRPVWLAAMANPRELPIILDAHRQVSRQAHRSLLVIVPDDETESPGFQTKLDESGWRYVLWSEGALPEETTQVLLADTHGEMGLWYRIAQITLMGSSLIPGQWGRDPNEPAAHGSAILYGPNVRRYLSSYSRYAEAGAARIVKDADSLAAAVLSLIPPDQSAAMAHAAWDVASEGAGVTDQILDLVQDTLDALEGE
ncbi:3-deoxy-D-manno-octulosonic acid transferase [Roseovarius sp. A21]|uniref:3-deoxy-D-manno-octulosonic acid transferase n=1 Tax=Roseovarius bejariae TaxID=2576383 RepID=A0A844D411_9RHOB|nr:glycosyltransferase N-terminal domain-containing protein [Roseovarius bejariae]MRU15998.1 3-deoxy-D-manno-octulosonic acid transferase [Roseovarius bejariae]